MNRGTTAKIYGNELLKAICKFSGTDMGYEAANEMVPSIVAFVVRKLSFVLTFLSARLRYPDTIL
jgi:hypothetical protein